MRKRTTALILLITILLATPAMATPEQADQVISVALQQLNAPYALNASAPDSFNCISLVTYCFNKVQSGKITGSGISGDYVRINSIKDLEPGDILCFKASGRQQGILSYHFGIYLGGKYFIHASVGAGKVVASKLKAYRKRFLGAIRVF